MFYCPLAKKTPVPGRHGATNKIGAKRTIKVLRTDNVSKTDCNHCGKINGEGYRERKG